MLEARGSTVFFCIFAAQPTERGVWNGDLSEWLKEHAWKVCIPLKGIEGSNPSVSAKMKRN